MKQNDKDILAGRTDLKEMPYSVPERYFEDFRSQMKPTSAKENSLYMRLAPYMAMAAMFILLVTGGTFLLRHATPEEEFTQEDFILFSDNLTNTIYFDTTEHIADAEIADEEIIEYLIYSGISAEEIENSK